MIMNERNFYYSQHDDGGGSSDVGSSMTPLDLVAKTRYQLSINMGNITYYNGFE